MGPERNRLASVSLASLFYLLLAILTMGANPFDGQGVAPMDLLVSHSGWSSISQPAEVTHPERSDILDAYLPAWISVKNSLRSGGNGFWIEASSGGIPGILNPANGMLTPSYLAFLLSEENWLGHYIGGVLKLLIAGLGTYLFLRLFLGNLSSLFGGAIYMLAGFNAAWFFWPQVSTSMWIPWLLWSSAGWMRSRHPWWLIGITLTASMLITGGFPSVSAYGFYTFALLMLVWISVDNERRLGALRSAALAGAAVGLAFLLTAIPLLSLAEYLGQFSLDWRTGKSSLSLSEHLHLLYDPYHEGRPRVEMTLYAGKVALAMALASLAILFTQDRREEKRLVVFGLLALGMAFLIVFNLVPQQWLRLVPALGSNLQSRLSVIIGLALAILAAAGLQILVRHAGRLRGRPWRYAALGGLVALVSFQIQDQMRLFRDFNAVVPKEWFFPETPTIRHVRDSIGPMEWVIADWTYMISGTLVAYGLPEWFAHSFKTPAEKAALGKLVRAPFVTPTAAGFPGDRIQLDAPLMNAFGIRHVLVAGGLQDHKPYRVLGGGNLRPAPPLPGNRLVQRMRLDEEVTLSAISLLLATYQAPAAPADAILTLRDSRDDIIATARVPRERIPDNRDVVFEFPHPLDLLPGVYSFELQLAEPAIEGRLTVWTTPVGADGDSRLWVNGTASDRAMRHSLLEPVGHDWIVHRYEPHIVVFENPRAARGAYVVRDLQFGPETIASGDVETIRTGDSTYRIRYSGREPGYVVFPMRHYPGWRARVDGEERALQEYLGIFPAVWMDGPGTIALDYRPTALRDGFPFTLAGGIGLFAVAGLALYRRPRPPGLY